MSRISKRSRDGRPLHQRLLLIFGAGIGGATAFGGLLATLNGLASVFTVTIAAAFSSVIGLVWLATVLWIRMRRPRWRDRGADLKITRLGATRHAAFFGMILLPWMVLLLRELRAPEDPEVNSIAHELEQVLRVQAVTDTLGIVGLVGELPIPPEAKQLAEKIPRRAQSPIARGYKALADSNFPRAHRAFAEAGKLDSITRSRGLLGQATTHMYAGNFDSATSYYRRVIRLAPADPDMSQTLGVAAAIASRLPTADTFLTRSIRVYRATLGPHHPQTAQAEFNLAVVSLQQNMADSALVLQQSALATRESVLGGLHPATAASLDHLASIHLALGNHVNADSLYRQALNIRRAVLPDGSLETATTENNLGVLLLERGNYDEARRLLKTSLATRRSVLGTLSLPVAESQTNLGLLEQKGGTREGMRVARELYDSAVAAKISVLGRVHLSVAGAYNVAGYGAWDAGDPRGAEAAFTKALTIQESLLPPSHIDIAITLSNLSAVRAALGDTTEALDLQRRAIAIKETADGRNELSLANSLVQLAELLVTRDRNDPEVERLLTRALRIREDLLVPDHPEVVRTMLFLSDQLRRLRELQRAKHVLDSAYQIERRARGPHSLLAGRAQSRRAILLLLESDYEGATHVQASAVATLLQRAGPSHPEVQQDLLVYLAALRVTGHGTAADSLEAVYARAGVSR